LAGLNKYLWLQNFIGKQLTIQDYSKVFLAISTIEVIHRGITLNCATEN